MCLMHSSGLIMVQSPSISQTQLGFPPQIRLEQGSIDKIDDDEKRKKERSQRAKNKDIKVQIYCNFMVKQFSGSFSRLNNEILSHLSNFNDFWPSSSDSMQVFCQLGRTFQSIKEHHVRWLEQQQAKAAGRSVLALLMLSQILSILLVLQSVIGNRHQKTKEM